jgi:hypothetical protein
LKPASTAGTHGTDRQLRTFPNSADAVPTYRMSAEGQKATSAGDRTTSALPPTTDISGGGCDVRFVPTPDSCAAEECRYSITSWTLESYSGNPALRKPSIISFAFFDTWLRAIHADIVKAGSISSTRAATSRASASCPRWAKADARQRCGPG